jgi:hypothetical protein
MEEACYLQGVYVKYVYNFRTYPEVRTYLIDLDIEKRKILKNIRKKDRL